MLRNRRTRFKGGLTGLGTIAAFLAAALGPSAGAGVVVPMNLPTLADHAGQVIVGEVAATRSYWAADPRRIETEVVFEQVEYLKGRPADASHSFTLTVPGGTVGEWTMRVSGAPLFVAGEKWVLFLLPEYRTFPVVGFAQGAFRVQADPAGVERVYDADHQPVTGLDARGFVQVRRARVNVARERLRASQGVRLAPCAESTPPTLSYADFVARVQPVLDRSRDHKLKGLAGRRVLVEQRAVPLRAAGSQDVAKPELKREDAVQPQEGGGRR